MAKITRKLKYSEWSFDEATEELKILVWVPNPRPTPDVPDTWPEEVKLNRVQMFSLHRFLVRASQNLSRKKRKRKEGKV